MLGLQQGIEKKITIINNIKAALCIPTPFQGDGISSNTNKKPIYYYSLEIAFWQGENPFQNLTFCDHTGQI
jgi:hypothetical protein